MSYIKIRICQDGLIYAETKGMEGEICTNYEKIIEVITGAKILEKEFTKEYYQENCTEVFLEERGWG